MKVARRHQKGYVFRKGNFWYVRYYDVELEANGATVHVQKCKQLVQFGGEYRSKNAVQVLADEFLAPFNNGKISPASTMTLNEFIDKRYLPWVKTHREASTYAGYKNAFERHIRKHGDIPLREVCTFHIDNMLEEIAREFNTAKTTIQHDKFPGIEWHGWHAFRRGLATNLHRLGVPDKIIQRILRHANVRVTQDAYIKTVDEDMREAMRRLETAAANRSKSAAAAKVM